MITPIFDNIPMELKRCDQWVNWKLETRDGRPTKPPYNPKTGKQAKSNAASTWASFDTAWQAYKTNGFVGVGFVVTEADHYIGFDIDHCRDPETGEITFEAQQIVNRLNTYTEISPSETGLRGFLKGKLPPGGRKKGNFEVYETGRYLTVTGHRLPSCPSAIKERQKEIEAIHAEIFPDKPKKHNMPKPLGSIKSGSLAALLDKAFNSKSGEMIQKLWTGDFSDYHSHSEADQALCNHLAFWLGHDPGTMDKAFRSSGLMREKWDKKHYGDGRTYGEATIQKAIDSTTGTYQSQRPQGREPREKIVVMQKFSPRPFAKDLRDKFMLKYDKFKRLFYYDADSGLWFENAEIILEVELRRNLLGIELLKQHYVAEILADVKSLAYSPETAEEPAANFIPFHNGIYDLDNQELMPFTPEMFFTSKLAVDFNPKAKCPMIDKIFHQLVDNPIQLFELIAYCFYRDYPYQKFFFLYGAGGNGKSVFANIVAKVLGKENIKSITPDQFQNNRFAAAGMAGKLANLAGEIKYEMLRDTDILKRLVGGDLIRAEKKYRNPFYFKNYAKLIFNTNELPRTADKTRAFYRRLYLIEFPNKFEGTNEDKLLMQKITEEEIEGLALQCIRYLRELKIKGFFFTVDDTTDNLEKKYEQLTNPLIVFLKERTRNEADATTPKREFASNFKDWLKEKQFRIWSDKQIGKEMKMLGYEAGKCDVEGHRMNGWFGLELLPV